MASLDMRTVLFSFVLINILSSLVILFLWIRYRNRYKGLGYLAIAFSLQMIAYILIIIRSWLPLWISIDFANALSVAGIFTGYIGLEKYTGRITSRIPGYAFLALLAILHIIFSYLKPDPTARYLIISLAYFILFGRCAWLMIKGAPKEMRSLTEMTGYVFAGLSLLSLFKIVDFIIRGHKPADYFNSDNLEAVVMFTYQMFIILLTISLSFMLNRHLLSDVKSEEEQFSTTFQTAPNAITVAESPSGKLIDINESFCLLTGYSVSEAVGKTALELSLWKNTKDREGMIEELLKNEVVHKREFQFRKKSGEVYTGLYSAKIIESKSGRRIITSVLDITERKKLLDTIRYERNLLRTLIDNIPDPVTIKDTEGRYLLNNKAHLQVIGAERQEEVIGKNTFDFFPSKEAEIYNRDDKTVLDSGKMIIDKVEYARHADTGFPYWHLTSKIPIKDDSGKAVQILTISHDVTERKRSEDALRETDEFNRSLLRTIPFGMDVVDETGTILFTGESFRQMFGNECTGKKCWELLCDNRQQCTGCPLMAGIKTGVTEICEVSGILGGKVFDIYHTGMMYHGKKAMLEIFHDITERKRNEGELIRSKEKAEESDRLKTAFLHNISHEIRTPMNAIVGFSNLLREPGITREEHDSYTEIIARSSNHLLSIVNDVIEISNVEAGRLKAATAEVSLRNLLNDLHQQFRPMAAEKNLQLTVDIPVKGEVSHISTDSTKLIQILSNLLNNAFKFTDTGNITFGYTVKEPDIEFFVSDTGIGIEPFEQPRIFERFYQVDSTVTRMHEGTGIGLSISKAYVELLGGKIWLRSAPGRGSIFYFTIPLLKNGHELNYRI
ncbi:MAG TPA: PAS domain S-box protein [Bacteroidales bacterium]|nr:PAS domain S-box protein [Bacteroidales bacterium]